MPFCFVGVLRCQKKKTISKKSGAGSKKPRGSAEWEFFLRFVLPRHFLTPRFVFCSPKMIPHDTTHVLAGTSAPATSSFSVTPPSIEHEKNPDNPKGIQMFITSILISSCRCSDQNVYIMAKMAPNRCWTHDALLARAMFGSVPTHSDAWKERSNNP